MASKLELLILSDIVYERFSKYTAPVEVNSIFQNGNNITSGGKYKDIRMEELKIKLEGWTLIDSFILADYMSGESGLEASLSDSEKQQHSQFYAAAFEKDGEIVVSYRGTDAEELDSSGKSLVDQSNFIKEHLLTNAKTAVGVPGIQFDLAKKYINKLKADPNNSGKTFLVTGHSLGGGLAQYAALMGNGDIPETVTWNGIGIEGFSVATGYELFGYKDIPSEFLLDQAYHGVMRDIVLEGYKYYGIMDENSNFLRIPEFFEYEEILTEAYDVYLTGEPITVEMFSNYDDVRKIVAEKMKFNENLKIKSIDVNSKISTYSHSKDFTGTVFKQLGKRYIIDQNLIEDNAGDTVGSLKAIIDGLEKSGLEEPLAAFHLYDVLYPFIHDDGKIKSLLNDDFISARLRKFIDDGLVEDGVVKYWYKNGISKQELEEILLKSKQFMKEEKLDFMITKDIDKIVKNINDNQLWKSNYRDEEGNRIDVFNGITEYDTFYDKLLYQKVDFDVDLFRLDTPYKGRETNGYAFVKGLNSNNSYRFPNLEHKKNYLNKNHSIITDEGDQIILAKGAQNKIWTGQGEDTVLGGYGEDRIYGGDDSDHLYGGFGNLLNGEVFYNPKGDPDVLTNWLFGEEGDDKLWGGSGNDKLVGGEGNDDLFGGDGEDIYEFYSGDGNVSEDTIYEFKSESESIARGRIFIDGLEVKGKAEKLGEFGNTYTIKDSMKKEYVIEYSGSGNLVIKYGNTSNNKIIIHEFKEKKLGILVNKNIKEGYNAVDYANEFFKGWWAGLLGNIDVANSAMPRVYASGGKIGCEMGRALAGPIYTFTGSLGSLMMGMSTRPSFSMMLLADPLILDLKGDGVKTTTMENGTNFDLDANHFAEKAGWASPDDAFLVLDRNKDGIINNGRELFGDATQLKDGSIAQSGFVALSEFDDNKDGVIDKSDSAYTDLKLWQDKNTDGITDEGELKSLSEAKIDKLDLGFDVTDETTAEGNIKARKGSYTDKDGKSQEMSEYLFVRDPFDTIQIDILKESPEVAEMMEVMGNAELGSLHQAIMKDESGELKYWVTLFEEEKDPTVRRDLVVNEILYEWADAGHIDENARGEHINARKVAFVEKVLAKEFEGADGTGNVNETAAVILESIYFQLAEKVYIDMMLETHLKPYWDKIVYYEDLDGEITSDVYDSAIAIQEEILNDFDHGKELLRDFTSALRVYNVTSMIDYEEYRDLFGSDDEELRWIIDSAGRISLEGTTKTDEETGQTISINDKIEGTEEVDAINGLGGNDELKGDKGSDFIYGGLGNDEIEGGEDDDYITGGEGEDTLSGDDGNDEIYGNAGNDEITGGLGNDQLSGGEGDDILVGGEGNDTYIFRKGQGNDRILNLNESDTIDRIIMENVLSDEVVLSRDKFDLVITVDESELRIDSYFKDEKYRIDEIKFMDGELWDEVEMKFSDEVIWTEEDILSKVSAIQGTAGDDLDLSLTDGTDMVLGGAGNDTITNTKTDTSTESFLIGDSGNDTITGNSGVDYIYGGEGDDTINGKLGNDILEGADGDDTYIIDSDDETDIIIDKKGQDTLKFSESSNINSNDLKLISLGDGHLYITTNNLDPEKKGVIVIDEYFSGMTSKNNEELAEKHRLDYKEDQQKGIENIEFANGEVWNQDAIRNQTVYFNGISDIENSFDATARHKYELRGNNLNDILIGNEEEDKIYGGRGHDTLVGDSADDTIEGNEGNDFIYGDAISEKESPIYDIQSLVFLTQDYLIAGVLHSEFEERRAKGIDKLYGGSGDDYIEGGDKKDYLYGEEDNDTIMGDGYKFITNVLGFTFKKEYYYGDDYIEGGSGNDTIEGHKGHDEIYGGSGDDTIIADGRDEILYTKSGHVTYIDHKGNDYIEGGTGNDTLEGGKGNDKYVFTKGDDHDTIFDLDGYDTLELKELNSSDLILSRNFDDLRIEVKDENDRITIKNYFIDSDANKLEEIVFADGSKWYQEDVFLNTSKFGDENDNELTGTNREDIIFGKGGNDTIDGGLGSDTLYGNSGDDTLIGGEEEDILEGGDGNDTLLGGYDNDILRGDNDNDTLRGNEGRDKLYGGSGNDELYGGSDNDQLYGEEGSDYLISGDGHNYLDGGAGDDTLITGEGSDILLGGEGSDILDGGVLNDSLQGGTGLDIYVFGVDYGKDSIKEEGFDIDSIKMLEGISLDNLTIRNERYDLVIEINGTEDSLTLKNYFIDDKFKVEKIIFFDGSEFDLKALTDSYTHIGTEGDDVIHGTDGNDIIFGLGGDDVLFGHGGDDLINGGEGDDILDGGTGDDILEGGEGNDILDGGAGFDELIGGLGDDIYIFGKDYGTDLVVDYNKKYDKTVVRFEGILPEEIKMVKLGSWDLEIRIEGTDDKLIMKNFFHYHDNEIDRMDFVYGIEFSDGTSWELEDIQNQNIYIYGGEGQDDFDPTAINKAKESFNNFIVTDIFNRQTNVKKYENYKYYEDGFDGNDNLAGGIKDDTILGGAGNDDLRGNKGDDYISGGSGDDVIQGNEGKDEIYGGTGLDFIDSGSEDDIIYAGSGDDRIFGAEGEDKLYGESGNDEIVGGKGNDYLEGAEGDDTLQGGDGNDELYSGSGNDEIHGNAGKDYIDAGTGNDTLFGGEGDDHYIFELGDGHDVITEEGWGYDKLSFGEGILETDITITKDIFDVILTIDSENSVRIVNYLKSNTEKVEVISFADGIEWDVYKMSDFLKIEGTEIGEEINGTEGDDLILGLGGADTLNGLEGKDAIKGGIDSDTIHGNEGDDHLEGESGADYLYGDANDDHLEGGTGNDELYGGTENDYLDGGQGSDKLYGQDGDDTLLGKEDDDILDGGSGDDTLYGDTGNDELYGGSGRDTLHGGENNDKLYGGDWSDNLYGESGDDELYGESGNDRLYGGSGNDTIKGGDYGDYLYGEEGNDTIHGESGSDSISGGSGDDTIYGGIGNDSITSSTGNNYIEGNEGNDRIITGSGNDEIYGNDGDDRIDSDSGSDKVYGGIGNDYLTSLGGNYDSTDELYGEEGNDTLVTDSGNDLLIGGSGDDILSSGDDVDRLEGGIGNDSLKAGDGHDTLIGGVDDDYLEGGDGDDTYKFELGFGKDIINNYDKLSDSLDTVEFGDGILSENALFSILENDLILGFTNTEDTLTFKNFFLNDSYKIENIKFGDGTEWDVDAILNKTSLNIGDELDNTLTGDATNDMIFGRAGTDTITGNAGDDSLFGEDAKDYIYGNDGEDSLYGGSGDDYIEGGEKADKIYGEEDNDTIDGGSGDDFIDGGSGNEVITGGLDNDTIYGQEGNDKIHGNENDDLVYGGSGDDELYGDLGNDYLESGTGLDELFGGADDDTLIGINNSETDRTVSYGGIGNDTLIGGYQLNGGEGNDILRDGETMSGEAGDDELYNGLKMYGGTGNDTIVGNSKNNIAEGGTGKDIIDTGHGNDILVGGADDDTLTGGTGDDVYKFNLGFGKDTIIESKNYRSSYAGNDTIHFGLDISSNDVSFTNDVNDLIIKIGETDEIRVKNYFKGVAYQIEKIYFEAEELTWTSEEIIKDMEFQAIYGTAGQDSIEGIGEIYGLEGKDKLFGGVLNDTLDGGIGDDYLEGGSGSDTYIFGIGYGSDQIIENYRDDIDTIKLKGTLTELDITLYKDGHSTYLAINGTSDRLKFSSSVVEKLAFESSTTILNINDLLHIGNSEVNEITGSWISDILDGKEGNDILAGRQGNDIYKFAKGYGHDTIIESDKNSDGTDKIILEDITISELNIERDSTDLILKVNADDSIRLKDYFNAYNGQKVEKIIDSNNVEQNISDLITYQLGSSLGEPISGTDAADFIKAGDGNDAITGGLGNDYLEGSTGSDVYVYNSGDGNDIIFESDTSNEEEVNALQMNNMASTDTRIVVEGKDLLVIVKETSEKVRVEGFFNSLDTGRHNNFKVEFTDVIISMDNILNYIEDSVHLTGTDKNDKLIGSKESDILDGGLGTDTLIGGEGIDTYVFGKGYGQDIIEGYNNDIIELKSDVTIDELKLIYANGNLILSIEGTDDTLTLNKYKDLENLNIKFADGTIFDKEYFESTAFQLNGTEGNDKIYSTGKSETLGHDGDDKIYGGKILDGGIGNDYLEGEKYSIYVFKKGYGRDIISKKYYDDFGYSGTKIALEDILESEITYERDGDTLILKINNSDDSLHIEEYFNYETNGKPTIQFSDDTFVGEDDLLFNREFTVNGTEGKDVLYGIGDTTFDGKSGNDILYGYKGDDTFIFRKGSGTDVMYDYLWSNNTIKMEGISSSEVEFKIVGKNLELIISETNEKIIYSDYYRSYKYKGGHNMLEKIEFTDKTVLMDEIEMMVEGTNLRDFYDLTDGNYIVDGKGGNDTIKGYNGDNTYIFKKGYGRTYIIDRNSDNENRDNDTVLLEGINFDEVNIRKSGSSLEIVIKDSEPEDKVVIYNHLGDEDYRIEKFIFADKELNFTEINDIASTIIGTSNDDIINGDSLRNIIKGEAGNDIIRGYDGDNILDGGTGNDYLEGGRDNDTYIYKKGYGEDTILGNRYGSNNDIIKLEDIRSDEVKLNKIGDNLEIMVLDSEGNETADKIKIINMYDGDINKNEIEKIQFLDTEWSEQNIRREYAYSVGTNEVDEITLSNVQKNDYKALDSDDIIVSGRYGDRIYGGSGNDIIKGSEAKYVINEDNIFDGGTGDDTLEGGLGNDTYIFKKGYGIDTINDIDTIVSEDKLIMEDLNSNEVLFKAIENDLEIIVIDEEKNETGDKVIIKGYFKGTGLIERIEFLDKDITEEILTGEYKIKSFGTDDADEIVLNNVVKNEYDAKAGNDIIAAGYNGGIIFGGTGDDTLTGSNGVDFLYGEEDNDTLKGESGEDYLDGGTGDDTLEGGQNNDTYIYKKGYGFDTIEDIYGELDKLLLEGINPEEVLAVYKNKDLEIQIEDSIDKILIKNYFYYNQIEEIIFADNTIWKSEVLNSIPLLGTDEVEDLNFQLLAGVNFSGLGGDDIIRASDLDDIINGNDGEDTIHGEDGIDILSGGKDDDKIYGGNENDYLYGEEDNDTLKGESGEDYLDGGTGNDYLYGGNNKDTYVFRSGHGSDTIFESDSDSNDKIIFEDVNIDDVRLSTGDYSSANDLIISNKDTTDVLTIKDFFLSTGKIEEIIFADVSLDLNNLKFEGTELDDNIKANSYSGTSIFGNGGNDNIKGTLADDIIYGGTGNDELYGRLGSDTYYFKKGDGQDKVIDFLSDDYSVIPFPDLKASQLKSIDKIIFEDINSTEVSVILSSETQLEIKVKGTDDKLIIVDYFNEIYGRIEEIHFADDVKWIYSEMTKIKLEGTDEDETIVLNEAFEYEVYGNGGNDKIVGGKGNDFINGGFDNDLLLGGEGNDTYIFKKGYGEDIIRDLGLVSDVDKLILEDIESSEVKLCNINDDLEIVIKNTNGNKPVDKIIIESYFIDNNQIEEIHFSDDIIWKYENIIELYSEWQGTEEADKVTLTSRMKNKAEGLDGNDKLYGGLNDDELYGGADNDYLDGDEGDDILDGGLGDDILIGDEGNDTFIFKKGYGIDNITNSTDGTTDKLIMEGILFEEVEIFEERINNLTYLTIGIKETEDKVRILYYSSDRLVNEIHFSDKTIIGRENIRSLIIDNHMLIGSSSSEELVATQEDKGTTINAYAGDDILIGNKLSDRLFAGSDNDILTGKEGNDKLYGGTGNDTYIYELGHGNDIISDALGLDSIKLGNGITKDTLKLLKENKSLIIKFVDNSNITIENYFNGNKIENIEFSNGIIWGTDEIESKIKLDGYFKSFEYEGNDIESIYLVGTMNNWIVSEEWKITKISNGTWVSNFVLEAGTYEYSYSNGTTEIVERTSFELTKDNLERSKFYGTELIDKITGDTNNNTILGGYGDDTLKGLAGDDIYQYNSGDGNDTIIEDTSGLDKIVFNNINKESVTFNRAEKDLFINVEASNLTIKDYFDGNKIETLEFKNGNITYTEIEETSINSTGTEFSETIYGMSGNDTITGLSGDDRLLGNSGDDTYIYNSGDGNDTINDNSGIDKLLLNDINFTDVIFNIDNQNLTIFIDQEIITIEDYYLGNKIESIEFKDYIMNSEEIEAIGITLIGTEGTDELYGTTGNDIIYGLLGYDELYGEEGNDTLDGGSGLDRLYGGEGNDTYVFKKGNETDIIDDSDTNTGTILMKDINSYEVELAIGYPAHLEIKVKNSTDKVTILNYFGVGKIIEVKFANGITWTSEDIENMTVESYGTDGKDTIILEGYLNNKYFALAGDDKIYGDSKVDIIDGGSGKDILDGRGGADILIGGSEDDTLEGGEGNDKLYGGSEHDNLKGEAGDDILEGGLHWDDLSGGAGSDTYVFSKGDGPDMIEDLNTISDGSIDKILLKDITSDEIKLSKTSTDLRIDIKNAESHSYIKVINHGFSIGQIEEIYFSDGEVYDIDKINEIISISKYGESWEDDELWAYGDLGRILHGEDGNDTLNGADGKDILFGDADNDTLIGNKNDDKLFGGNYNDIYIYNLGDGNDIIFDYSGTDTLEFKTNILSDSIVLTRIDDNIEIKLSDDSIVLIRDYYKGNQIETIKFSNGETWNTTTIESNVVILGFTKTFEYLGPDTDSVYLVGTMNNWIQSAEWKLTKISNGTWISNFLLEGGNYEYSYSDGTTELLTRTSFELIADDKTSSKIFGTSGNDPLTGTSSDDIILGGYGQDILTGLSGNDTYEYNLGDGSDTIVELSGNDKIKLNDINSKDIKLSQNDENLIIENNNEIILTVNNFFTEGSDTIEEIIFLNNSWNKTKILDVLENGNYEIKTGIESNDTLIGTNTNDKLIGLYGDDTLYGYEGSDKLIGGLGNDRLYGGLGDDIYVYDSGKDIILEESGNDTVVLNNLDLSDIILKRESENLLVNVVNDKNSNLTVIDYFAEGSDTIESIEFSDNTIWTNNEILENLKQPQIIDKNDYEVKTGTNQNEYLLGNDLNNYLEGKLGEDRLYGYNGSDFLDGGLGNDYLEGGTGDDTYLFGRDYGQDRIKEISGNDELILDVNPLDLIFNKNGTDLNIMINGTDDEVTIKSWYKGEVNQVEEIKTSDGNVLISNQVDQLIQAMAEFTGENNGLDWTRAINEKKEEVENIISVHWQNEEN